MVPRKKKIYIIIYVFIFKLKEKNYENKQLENINGEKASSELSSSS